MKRIRTPWLLFIAATFQVSPCSAAVVLVDLLPLNFTVGLFGPRARDFDLNADSVNDYRFDDGGGGAIVLYPLGTNRTTGHMDPPDTFLGRADPVPPGALLGLNLESGLNWLSNPPGGIIVSFHDFFGIFGRAILGLEFGIGGQTHYGWVEFDSIPESIHLLRAGYESEPGVPIQVPIPEPAGLLTAAGALLFCACRSMRRRRPD